MTASPPHVANALHWVRAEIEASLARVRKALEQYLEAPEDRGLLAVAGDELRQVYGTVRMVQCFGAEMLAEQMLALLAAMLEDRVSAFDEAFATLSGASLQLSDYIDLLAHGEDDRAVVLQPVINELRLARGEPLMTEADLFAAQARAQAAPMAVEPPLAEAEAQQIARRELAGFQAAFLQWFRGQDADAAMRRMGQIADNLAASIAQPELRRVWTGFAVLAECLSGSAMPDSLDLKRQFGRAGSQLRLLAEAGEAAAAAQAAEQGWQVLYYVACLPQQSVRAGELLAQQGVAAFLPSSAKIDELRRRLRGPNSSILERLHAEIQQDFARIKDGIDLAVRTGGHSQDELSGTRERLLRLANTLAALGLSAPQQTLTNQARALDVRQPSMQQWLDLATALLRVEHSLEEALFRALGRHDGAAARPFAEIETEVPHAQDLRNSTRALLRESLIDFSRLKSGVDDYLKHGDPAGLADGPRLLHQTAAVLRILDDDRAADLLSQLEQFAASGTLGAGSAQPEDYARYADAVACVELYLEGRREGLPRPDRIVDDLAAFVGRLAIHEPSGLAEAVPAEPLPVDIEAAPTEAVDPEIREIFVEEAAEVLTELRRLLPQLLRAPEDRTVLGELRRGFHTLKGSGRMVGALRIGEFGWAVESLLNRCLEGALAVGKPVLDVVADAIGLLPGLIGNFRGEGLEDAAVAALIERAAVVASGRAAPESDVLTVFVDDARERLAFVGRWLEGRDLGEHEFVAEPDLIRAFHTLKGSAAVVNAGAVSQLAALFEHHLNGLRFEGRLLSLDTLAVLADGLAALRSGIEDVAAGRAAESDPRALAHWRERLDALLGASLAATPAPRAPIDEAFTVAALDALQPLELLAHRWSEQPQMLAATTLVEGFAAIAADARRVGCEPIGRVTAALSSRLQAWQAGASPGPGFFATLLDLIETVFQQLDAYREGGLEEDVSETLARVQTLPAPAAAAVPMAAAPALADADFDPELLEIFGAEAEELLEALDRDHALLQAVPANAAVLDGLRRSLHTLKGSARTAGVPALGEVAHQLESLLDAGGDSPGPLLQARLAAGLDGLHGLVDRLRRGEPTEAAAVLAAIADALPAVAPTAAVSSAPTVFDDFDALPDFASEQPASTLTVTMETPAGLAFDLDGSSPRADDSNAGVPGVETVTVETLPEPVLSQQPLLTSSLSVAPEPPLFSFDEMPAAANTDAALPSFDPGREVYWSAEVTPVSLSPDSGWTLDAPIAAPVQDHPLLTAADLPADSFYAEAASGPLQPLLGEPATVDLALAEFDQPVAAFGSVTTEPLLPSSPLPQNSSALDVELSDIFAAEADELIEVLDDAFEAWRNGDAGAPVGDILRVLHTLKGGARMAGLDAMGDVAHELESQVSRAQYSGEFPDAATFAVLRAELDSLQQLHDRLRRGEAAALVAAPPPAPVEPAPLEPMLATTWSPELFWRPESELGGLPQQRRETARVPVDTLDAMLNEAGEISIYRSRLEEHNAGLRAQLLEMTQTVDRVREQLRMMEFETEAQIAARGLSTGSAERSEDRYAQDFDPLEMDRYSRMQELSRALAESINDLASLQGTMEQVVGESETLLQQQSRVNTGVQQGLMGTLMVPFSRQLQRLARVVRQTAQENGKQADVQFAGAEAELDRNVLERMTAPLEHLLRNAVVHGIESPDARLDAGKPAVGRIDVQLRREGSQLLVEVADDGGGLDFAGIRDKAIEHGLMSPDTQLSDDDLSSFIFQPGFSTAKTLTQDAGRGIGMDVVASEVKQLGGALELRSEFGRGTRFLVRLPLSLAVSQALMVMVGGEAYAVPLSAVEGIARIPRRDFDDYLRPDGALFVYGGRGYRVGYLGDHLGQSARPPDGEGRTLTAILVRLGEGLSATAERRVALIVDSLVGNREIVSKNAGPQLSAVPGISGATILADGRVVLILDVPALVSERARRLALAGAGDRVVLDTAVDLRETVMVVDDSVTMRRVAERLLTRQGYRVITARDGLDAIALLQTETPGTLLLDIEMPRADGFEVAAFVRNTPRLAPTPIIMITSRSGEKHRERARSLRVERYLIKPYQEDQLLTEINAVRRERRT